MAIENGPFIDDFPIKTTIYSGFSMAMLNNQMLHRVFDVSWVWVTEIVKMELVGVSHLQMVEVPYSSIFYEIDAAIR